MSEYIESTKIEDFRKLSNLEKEQTPIARARIIEDENDWYDLIDSIGYEYFLFLKRPKIAIYYPPRYFPWKWRWSIYFPKKETYEVVKNQRNTVTC